MQELLPGIRYHRGENKNMRDWEPCNSGSVRLYHRAADAVVSVRELHESW